MNIQNIRDKGLILYEVISGSQAYGTNTPTSDQDIRGVYIAPLDTLLGLGYDYQKDISDETNDTTFFEIKKFVELLSVSNPSALEILNVPEDCVLYKHPLFDFILKEKENFITKKCKDTLGTYAIKQIQKARGLNKKIVNPMDKEKKTPLDFCSVIEGEKSYPLKDFLQLNRFDQKFCGLVNIPNARDIYALFYDYKSWSLFGDDFDKEKQIDEVVKLKKEGKELGLGYKGIIIEGSNDIRLSSIPKGEEPIAQISYNKDGYAVYCKQYKEYWDWQEKKNPHRYNETIAHNKGYDGKNMLHCHRLLDMCIEIAKGQGIIIRRPNVEQLLRIKKGAYDYDLLIEEAEQKMNSLDDLFEKSNLPDEVSVDFCNELLIKIRKEFYNL